MSRLTRTWAPGASFTPTDLKSREPLPEAPPALPAPLRPGVAPAEPPSQGQRARQQQGPTKTPPPPLLGTSHGVQRTPKSSDPASVCAPPVPHPLCQAARTPELGVSPEVPGPLGTEPPHPPLPPSRPSSLFPPNSPGGGPSPPPPPSFWGPSGCLASRRGAPSRPLPSPGPRSGATRSAEPLSSGAWLEGPLVNLANMWLCTWGSCQPRTRRSRTERGPDLEAGLLPHSGRPGAVRRRPSTQQDGRPASPSWRQQAVPSQGRACSPGPSLSRPARGRLRPPTPALRGVGRRNRSRVPREGSGRKAGDLQSR